MPTLYIKVDKKDKFLIVSLYVDDLIFTGGLGIDSFKSAMESEFEMTDLGLMRYFLGIEVHQSNDGIFISQSRYANEVLKRLNMEKYMEAPTMVMTRLKLKKEEDGACVDSSLFKRLVGSLVYLTATRSDIMYGVSLISRFMESSKDSHCKVGKRILRYVSGKKDIGILIPL